MIPWNDFPTLLVEIIISVHVLDMIISCTALHSSFETSSLIHFLVLKKVCIPVCFLKTALSNFDNALSSSAFRFMASWWVLYVSLAWWVLHTKWSFHLENVNGLTVLVSTVILQKSQWINIPFGSNVNWLQSILSGIFQLLLFFSCFSFNYHTPWLRIYLFQIYCMGIY